MKRHCCTIAFAFLALLAFPRTGSAGIGEIILEMSGPQMIGFGGECKFDLARHMKLENCKVFPGMKVAGESGANPAKYRLATESALYFSTGVGKHGDVYDKGEVLMLGVDPIVEARLVGDERLGIYVGAGATLNFILDKDDVPATVDAKVFNGGFKLRPFALSLPLPRGTRLDVEVNLRFYPDEFTPADFGHPELPPAGRDVEVVKGLSLAFHF
jgi:hypothetical protein